MHCTAKWQVSRKAPRFAHNAGCFPAQTQWAKPYGPELRTVHPESGKPARTNATLTPLGIKL